MSAGYYTVAIDGIWGNGTKAAIKTQRRQTIMQVINQFGKYLDGIHRDAVIDAAGKGASFVMIDWVRVDILPSADPDVIRVDVKGES